MGRQECVGCGQPRELSEIVSQMKKPHMFNMCLEQSIRNIPKAFAFSAVCGYLFWKFHCDRRKRAYREFHENYNIDAEFERMKAKNLFQSC